MSPLHADRELAELASRRRHEGGPADRRLLLWEIRTLRELLAAFAAATDFLSADDLDRLERELRADPRLTSDAVDGLLEWLRR